MEPEIRLVRDVPPVPMQTQWTQMSVQSATGIQMWGHPVFFRPVAPTINGGRTNERYGLHRRVDFALGANTLG